METLEVGSNLISIIESGTFSSMPRLTTLGLEDNLLTDVWGIYATRLRSIILDGNVRLQEGTAKVSSFLKGVSERLFILQGVQGRSETNNYQPISVFLIVMKVFESTSLRIHFWLPNSPASETTIAQTLSWYT